MSTRIGCVPFVNAKPLIAQFADPAVGVEVVLAPPSQLPAMLDRGEAAAVLASSFDALRTPNRRVAAGVAIASKGPVESVRVFSKVPLERAETLALDASSLTSNALAHILLHELYGVCPIPTTHAPDLQGMLSQCDAAVLIGDKGMTASSNELHVLDLGQGWLELTGLPFVWALWIGAQDLDSDLAAKLLEARLWGEEHVTQVAREAAATPGWNEAMAHRYLSETMSFAFDAQGAEALVLFGQMMVAHGLIDTLHAPEIVGGPISVV